MRRIALIILFSRDKRVLLQHKSPDAPNSPNMWCCWGGGIETRETPLEAAKRELQEELQATNVALSPFIKTVDREKLIERHYFSGEIDVPVEELRIRQREGDDLGYFSLAQMERIAVNPAHREIVVRFLTRTS